VASARVSAHSRGVGIVETSDEHKQEYYTNCIKLLRFLYLAQMSGSLEHGAPLELVEGLGMARCSLCKAQLLITIGITEVCQKVLCDIHAAKII